MKFTLKVKKYNLLDAISLPFLCSPIPSSIIVLLALLGALVPTFQIVAVARFIDSAIVVATEGMPIDSVYLPITMVVIFIAFSWINSQLANFAKVKQRLAIKEKYRTQITTQRAKLAYKYIEDHDTWDLIKRVSEKAEDKLFDSFDIFVNIINLGIRVIGIIILIIVQVWWAALLIFSISVPLFYLALKSGKSQYEVTKETAKFERKYDYLEKIMIDRENIEERTLFRYEKMINKRYAEQYDIAYKKWHKVNLRWFIRMKLGSIITACISIIVAIVLINPTINGLISIGLFMSLVSGIFSLVYTMSWQLTYIVDEASKKNEYMKDLNQFMALETVEGATNKPIDVVPIFRSIEFKDVSFTYPGTDKVILDKLNLKMVEGLHYAFVGANGAGKTTITKLLTGLYPEYTGEIFINDKELQQYSHEKLISFFSVLYQDFAKYFTTLKNNIFIGNINVDDDELIRNKITTMNLQDAVDKLPKGMNTPLGKIEEDGHDLSGGEWQRLAMARAIYSPAPFRILDEPTANLDPISESKLYEEFEEISMNKTTLFISHRLGSTMLADMIFVIDEGRVAEQGTHQELIDNNSLYSKMYNTQKEWYR